LPGRGNGTTNSQSEAQTAQPELIFQFAKQRFHFLSLALGAVKRWRVWLTPVRVAAQVLSGGCSGTEKGRWCSELLVHARHNVCGFQCN